MKKAQKGNNKAFLKLFQQYKEDIYRMAYVYVKNKDDALDVVQEVAYQSFKKINTLKNPQYLKTWLMRITINSATNVINKKQKVVHLNPEHEKFIGVSNEDILLAISLQELLDTLVEEEKNVVILKFYHNYTFKEISEILEMPLGTAKSVLYRALKKLRREVKEGDICE